ncbi:YraN family protein [Psychroserpens sp. XS_ASV72]|uniref:YraN family protein n=1 Tax=Psychroserpens sp. XS_ASV72 TaxID=3241293 RepID=UPI003510F28B
MKTTKDFGNKGEDLAATFLLENGYTILERNYIFQKAEVDIIAQKDDVIVAVEVKTRSTKAFGDPQDFLKPKQIQRIVKAMDNYVVCEHIDAEVRFDIIAIINSDKTIEIEHLQNAFYHF